MTGRPRACRSPTTFATFPSTHSSAPGAKRSGASLASSTTNDPSRPCDLPTRPTVTVSGRSNGEPAGRSSVDDLELHAPLLACAARADDRAQGARDPALPPDHLAKVVFGDVQTQHERVLVVDFLDPNRVGVVDELLREVLEQVGHDARRGSSPSGAC